MIAPLVHKLQVLVPQDLPLPITNHLLLVLYLGRPQVILLDHLLVRDGTIPPGLHLLLILLIDQLLGGLAKLFLLLSVIVHEELVLETLLLYLA